MEKPTGPITYTVAKGASAFPSVEQFAAVLRQAGQAFAVAEEACRDFGTLAAAHKRATASARTLARLMRRR